MVLVVKLHAWLFQLFAFLLGQLGRLVFWAFVAVPFRAVSAFFKTCAAWVHMEIKRWLAVIVGGLIVLVAAQALIKASPSGSNWRLVALLLCLMWLVAAFSAARMTLEYLSIRRVRQSQAFREIHQMAGEAAKHAKAASTVAVSTAADKTRNTPAGKAFRKNRDAAAAEQEQERQAAERDEAERIAAAEQVARDQRETERAATAAAEELRRRQVALRRPARARNRIYRPVTAPVRRT